MAEDTLTSAIVSYHCYLSRCKLRAKFENAPNPSEAISSVTKFFNSFIILSIIYSLKHISVIKQIVIDFLSINALIEF